MDKNLIISKMGMFTSEAFGRECEPSCIRKAEENDIGYCLNYDTDYLCLTEHKRFSGGRLQLEFLRPYVWVSKEDGSKSYGWVREDGQRVLDNEYNGVGGFWEGEVVLAFCKTGSSSFC